MTDLNRRYARCPVPFEGAAAKLVTPTEAISCTILNMSIGGFGIALPTALPFEPGELLRLDTATERCPVKLVHQMQEPGGATIVGLERTEELADDLHDEEAAKLEQATRKLKWIAAGFLLVIGTAICIAPKPEKLHRGDKEAQSSWFGFSMGGHRSGSSRSGSSLPPPPPPPADATLVMSQGPTGTVSATPPSGAMYVAGGPNNQVHGSSGPTWGAATGTTARRSSRSRETTDDSSPRRRGGRSAEGDGRENPTDSLGWVSVGAGAALRLTPAVQAELERLRVTNADPAKIRELLETIHRADASLTTVEVHGWRAEFRRNGESVEVIGLVRTN